MRIPPVARRIIFFGGDAVSLFALKRLHARSQRLAEQLATGAAAASATTAADIPPPGAATLASESTIATAAVASTFHDLLRVVVPPTPPKHPLNTVRRYCEKNGLPFVEVEDRKRMHPEEVLRFMMTSSAPSTIAGTSSEGIINKASPPPLSHLDFDAAVVVSFRYFFPNALLEHPSFPPCINLHPSLLPKYRGASPLYTPLMRGDVEGGASIIKLSPRELMDSGDILAQARIPVPLTEDARTYAPRALDAGCVLLEAVLDDFSGHWARAVPQERRDVHFKHDEYHAPLLTKQDGLFDFATASGHELYCRWRGLVATPFVPSCLFNRAQLPVAGQIRQAAKLLPARMVLNEAVPFDSLPAEDRARLEAIEAAGVVTHSTTVTTTAAAPEAPSAASGALDANHAASDSAEITTAACGATLCVAGATPKATTPLAPGALVVPALRGPDHTVVAIKCRSGWLCMRAMTIHNSEKQPADVLARSMMLKPGVVYQGVFEAAPVQPVVAPPAPTAGAKKQSPNGSQQRQHASTSPTRRGRSDE
jgi:methionyl-tRNA formyltransferase